MESGATTPGLDVTERSTLLASDHAERGQYGLQSTQSKPPREALEPLTRTSKWTKAKYYLPVMSWLPNYSFSLLGGDFLAGLTVACILIPQSVSYASSLAKMSPISGLFSAAIPGAVYAMLGSSRQLNVAPEAALSLLVGQAITAALRSDPHHPPDDPEAVAIAITTMITLQAGIFSFILGIFRLGFIDVVLSRALLRGFVSAIAIVIMVEQFIQMLGLAALEERINPSTTLEKMAFLVEYVWSDAHLPTAFIGFGALFSLVIFRWSKSFLKRYWFIYRIPEVLVIVVAFTMMSDVFDWDQYGVSILGDVPIKTGQHFFQFPLLPSNWKYLRGTTSTAMLCAVVGFLDSIVAVKQNAAMYGYSISPNRELVALGAGNIVTSFIPGTLPAAGSITRSRINGDVGGRSQMASVICSTLVLCATFFFLPMLYYLPKCVLGAVIWLVVFSLLAELPGDLVFFWKMRAWIDLLLITLTFLCTLLWDVEIGVLVSVIISLLLLVRRSSKPRMTILGRIPGTSKWEPVNDFPEAQEDIPGTLIVRIRDNLDFANTAQLKERLRRLELYGIEPNHPSDAPRRPQANILVFHLADVETCDASAAQIFYEILENYNSRGVIIFITHLRDKPQSTFEKAGIVQLLGKDSFFVNVSKAIERIEMVEREVIAFD